MTEEILLRLTRSLAAETVIKNLCLDGGVDLNCVANGKVLRDGKLDRLWVQPAAGYAGGAIGAALVACHHFQGHPRHVNGAIDGMHGSYLGPDLEQDEIEARLAVAGARFRTVGEAEMIAGTADALAAGEAIGWFQGRMEFGPRALGARSILGNHRSPSMQKTLNLKVKYRESFRPFAPSILREDVADWFEMACDIPYMLLVAPVAYRRRRAMTAAEEALFGIEKLYVPRSDIPAVTHVDYSARVQTVHRESNPRYYDLIDAFGRRRLSCSGEHVINVRGEPIVCTPEDALRCFMGSEIARLAIGDSVLLKADQEPALKQDYKDKLEFD